MGQFYGSASINDVLTSLNIDSPGIISDYESSGLISLAISMFFLSQTLATIGPEFIPFTNSMLFFTYTLNVYSWVFRIMHSKFQGNKIELLTLKTFDNFSSQLLAAHCL